MSKTKIEWAQETWNPVRGCSRISEGCRNCYAERQAGRFCELSVGQCLPIPPFHGFVKRTPSGPRWTGRVELIESMLDVPLRRRKPTTFFVNSMSDLFHESLSDEAIDRVFAVMALCPQHTFQVLTKRAERMRTYFADANLLQRLEYATHDRMDEYEELETVLEPWPLPNVWLGVSCEDQEAANARIPLLLRTPTAVRFVSAEPLLGPVNLGLYLRCQFVGGSMDHFPEICDRCGRHAEFHQSPGIHWVICGGESGPGARPCQVEWIRRIVRQCAAAGVACFVKQLGARPRGPEQSVPDWVTRLNRKASNWEVWPDDLRVRQMPEVQR